MQSGDFALAVLLDNFGFNDQWDPIVTSLTPCLEAEHRETSGETRDTSEHGFERFGQVVRNEILEDLDRCDPRLPLVGDSCLSTYTHDHLVMMHAVHQILEGIREDFRVGVNLR